jgi:hypothetical protein
MRQSGELRPVWACSACSGRSLPFRTVRLTFPSLAVVYGRACPSRGLPQSGSAMTTRPNHPLPRQDFHLQACQRPKAAHRRLLFALPHVLSAARVTQGPDPTDGRSNSGSGFGNGDGARIDVLTWACLPSRLAQTAPLRRCDNAYFFPPRVQTRMSFIPFSWLILAFFPFLRKH